MSNELVLGAARAAVDAATTAAQADGTAISVVVVDHRGYDVLAQRGDGAPWFTVGVARAKAATAALMGADIVIDPKVESAYAKLPPGKRAVIFECVGVPGLLQQVFEAAPRDARIVVAGVCMEPDRIEPLFGSVKELSIQFVLGYTPDEFARCLRLLAEGQVEAEALITGKVGLDGVKGAFAELANPERHTKILVEPWR